MSGAGLDIDIGVRRGSFELSAALTVAPGQVAAVLGANGAGKSTLLAAVAGLASIDRGSIRWGERTLSRPGATVPVADRGVGLLGQDPLLFPHLSVRQNVEFGPRSRRLSDYRQRADRWLSRLGADHLAERRPSQLSGGQAARVAIARTLAAEPEVLLLDEPLAALDVGAAPELRAVLSQVLAEHRGASILVSHDVLDVAMLADLVVVVEDGAVVETGTRADVLSEPRAPFTAAFVGVNLVRGATLGVLCPGEPEPGAQLRFRPSAVSVSAERVHEHRTWRTTVRWLEPVVGGIRVRLHHDGDRGILADVDPAELDPTWLHEGAQVWAHVPEGAVEIL